NASQSALITRVLEDYLALIRDAPSGDLAGALNELGLAHLNHGMMLNAAGRSEEAERSFLRAIELFEEQSRATPIDQGTRSRLSDACYQLGRLRRASGRWAEAVHDYERGAALLEGLAAERPPGRSGWSTLATIFLNLGRVRIEAGEPAGALRDLRRSLALYEGPAKVEPPSAVRRNTF